MKPTGNLWVNLYEAVKDIDSYHSYSYPFSFLFFSKFDGVYNLSKFRFLITEIYQFV
jgi:hypothetical protein